MSREQIPKTSPWFAKILGGFGTSLLSDWMVAVTAVSGTSAAKEEKENFFYFGYPEVLQAPPCLDGWAVL